MMIIISKVKSINQLPSQKTINLLLILDSHDSLGARRSEMSIFAKVLSINKSLCHVDA